MKRFSFVFAAAVALTLGVGSARAADEQIDNPLYQLWAKFKPGTYATIDVTSSTTGLAGGAGGKTESTITRKLVEVKPDKVVVEIATTGAALMWPGMQPEKIEIPAKLSKSRQDIWMLPPGVKATVLKTGNEVINFKGKHLNCARVEMEIEGAHDGQTVVINMIVWVDQTVPGGIVKSANQSTLTKDGQKIHRASEGYLSAVEFAK